MDAREARKWWAAATIRLEPLALAALSLGAAAIHFAVITEHFAEYFLFGAFFSLIGWFQALWAVAYVIRPARWLIAFALLVNAATVLLWVWAHLIGLTFGPDPGRLEPTAMTDLMATAFEVVLVAWLVAVVRHPTRGNDMGLQPTRGDPIRIVVVIALVVAVAFGTTVALAQPPM